MVYNILKKCNNLFLSLILCSWMGLYAQSDSTESPEVKELLSKLDSAQGSSRVTTLNKLFIATYYSAPMRAFGFVTEALSTAREVKDEKGEAYSHSNLGIFFLDRANYASSLEQFMEALKIRERRKDSAGLSDIYTNLGMLYQYQELFPKAIEYYYRSLVLDNLVGDSITIGYTCNNLGNAWMAYNQLDSARKYLEFALIYKASDEYSLPSTLDNLGKLYLAQGKEKEAEEFYNRALQIRKESDNLLGIAESMMRLAEIELNRGNAEKAIVYGKEGYAIATQINSPELLPEASRLIARAYHQSKKPADAYVWLERYLSLKDSLFSTEILTRIVGMEAAGKIQNQKTEIELLKSQKELAQAEADRRRLFLWALFVGMILLVLLAIVFYSRYKTKKKANAILQARNIEIEGKNLVIGRQHQLIKDSIIYARNIQESFLPSAHLPPLAGGEMFIINQPRDIVSGDFYWIDFIQGKLIFALADGTGHGVPGAFISLIGITLIKTSLRELPDATPDKRLAWLHTEVIKALGNQDQRDDFSEGMDIALISYDPKLKILEYAGAQRPLVLFQQQEMRVIKGDRISLGDKRMIDPVFTLHRFPIQVGDSVYLFTDGLTDLLGGPKRRRITTPAFLNWLAEVNLIEFELREMELKQKIQNWKADFPQADDILISGIEFLD